MPNTMKSFLIPSNQTAAEFGKVNVETDGSQIEVQFTILMPPQGQESEGWQTGVAIDASGSMKEWFGQRLLGKVPPELTQQYEQRGLVEVREMDGRKLKLFKREAFEDAINKGYLQYSPNIIQPLAREFVSYLAGGLDADGGTTVIYWACGDGGQIEVLGDYTEDQCRTLDFVGPKTIVFGNGTALTPAVRYFVERFKDAKRGMYIFITDGRLDDLESVKKYTVGLARAIAAGKANSVKCVLIGIGNEVDERQMDELDNLDTGTDIDIWDHKIAKEMRSLVEIFAEVVSENQIVAPTATIYGSDGKVVRLFSDGLPARASITLPASSTFFDLEVGGRRIRQSLTVPVE